MSCVSVPFSYCEYWENGRDAWGLRYVSVRRSCSKVSWGVSGSGRRVCARASVNVCEFTHVRMCVHVSSARVCK